MKQLSALAREFRQKVEDPARFLETCEGGDAGTPEQPSIWFLGIEPGWTKAQQAAEEQPETEYDRLMATYHIEAQLKHQYNRKAFQMLAGIDGLKVEDYLEFARRKRPFEQGSKGYFKANLFPQPFNKVSTWDDWTKENTGFETKEEYRHWLRENRFKVLKHWIEKHRPKLVIGTSYSHLHDFMAITGTKIEPEAHHFEVNDHPKRMYVSSTGTVPLVVTPHLIGASGLNSDKSIEIVASTIRKTLSI